MFPRQILISGLSLLLMLFSLQNSFAEEAKVVAASPSPTATQPPPELKKICTDRLSKVPNSTLKEIEKICSTAVQMNDCQTTKGEPIFHWERSGDPKLKGSQKILVISLIHGDEPESAAVSSAWIERLKEIQPRNTWRVIPV